MDTFTFSDITRLANFSNHWAVSLFLPTHRTGTEMQQDPIRLKNLMRDAENQLKAAGVKDSEVAQMFKQAEALFSNRDFWQHQSDGLALFASAEHFELFRLPVTLPEQVIVARRFQFRPLLPLLTGDGHYFVLAISQNDVRLYQATRHAIDEVHVDDLPTNFREAVGLDDLERELQFHTRSGNRGGQRQAMFFGHGSGEEFTKEQLEKYFRLIDEKIRELLNGDQAPLILAGVDYYFPLFSGVSKHPSLHAEGVSGNPEHWRPEELQAKAWPLVEQGFQKSRDAALARFRQLAGTGQTTTNLAEALQAANDGRVETLFIGTTSQHWGNFDAATREVTIDTNSHANNEDLIDRLALETYAKKGTVYAISDNEIPDGHGLAVIYRF